MNLLGPLSANNLADWLAKGCTVLQQAKKETQLATG